MTVWVCLQCGDLRDDASASCPNCGYDPDPTDVQACAKQWLASDQYHSRDELEAIALRVKAGEQVEFDPATTDTGWMREETKRLTAEYGTVPPPWVMFNEHPYSMRWRMGAGESHKILWWEWWSQQDFSEDQKIAYFRRWPPPYCWLAFLIEAVWEVGTFEAGEKLAPYFERTNALGFGGQQDYERDLDDPKWLEQ